MIVVVPLTGLVITDVLPESMRSWPVAERAMLYAICEGALPGATSCNVLMQSVQAAGSGGGAGGLGVTVYRIPKAGLFRWPAAVESYRKAHVRVRYFFGIAFKAASSVKSSPKPHRIIPTDSNRSPTYFGP